jgi:hypothetical protein
MRQRWRLAVGWSDDLSVGSVLDGSYLRAVPDSLSAKGPGEQMEACPAVRVLFATLRNGRFLSGPIFLSQFPFQDFAGSGLGQALDKLDRARTLKM